MQPQVPASGLPFPTVPEVIFTNWREVLHRSGLTPGMQAVYAMAVSGYLEYCGRNAVSVTKASAQAYMADVIRRGLAKHPQLWMDALNWFFREGRRHCGAAPQLADRAMPTLGQADTGAQPWERRLIERLRLQHYAWRTEKTYREWAWRLASSSVPATWKPLAARTLRPFSAIWPCTDACRWPRRNRRSTPDLPFSGGAGAGGGGPDRVPALPARPPGSHGAEPEGMPPAVRGDGRHGAADGGADVRQRSAGDGVAPAADQGRGLGAAAGDRAGRQRRQGPRDDVAGEPGGTVARPP